MNGYVCFWQQKRCEVHAENPARAQEQAVQVFQATAGRKRVKRWDIAVVLAEKDGEQVVHDPAILD